MQSVPKSGESPKLLARRRRPMTGQAFLDLAIWMVGLGLAMGLIFPFAIIALGPSADVTLRAAFFAGTVAAGLIVGTANYALARRIVGARVRELSAGMRHVSDRISESTYTGDWSTCTPAACELVVDSDDELGDAAKSFNHLIEALGRSRQVEEAMAAVGASLVANVEVRKVAKVALDVFVERTSARAGAFGVVKDGKLVAAATSGIDRAVIESWAGVRNAVRDGNVTCAVVPDDLVVDVARRGAQPRQVVVVPLHFKCEPVGVVVLAYARQPAPEVLRLLGTLANACGVALNNALTNQRLERLAAIDPLTGTYNRRFGDRRLREEWSRSVRSSTPLGLLSIDLDHFKAVNDTFGHLIGDRVLQAAVSATRLALREGDVLVRTGGEEFLVVLPGATSAEVEVVGNRVLRSVATASVWVEPDSVQVTVSLGGGSWPETEADGPDDLLARLDESLYQSKRAGRNRLTMVTQPAVQASTAGV